MDSTTDPTDGIQSIVNLINEAGEDFRILAQGTENPETLLETIDPPWDEYIKQHDPWDRAFIIWFEGEPARIATNFRDQWSVTPTPSKGVIKRANIYAKLASGKRGLTPGLTYEPAEEETTAIKLELHPIKDREDLFRTVAADGSPIPDIQLQVWDFGIEEPAIDAYRHFDRNEPVRVTETGEQGRVRGTNGRTVTLDLPNRNEDFPKFHPDELELIESGTDENTQ